VSVNDETDDACNGSGAGASSGFTKHLILRDEDGRLFNYIVTVPTLPDDLIQVGDIFDFSLVVEKQSLPFAAHWAHTLVLSREGEIVLLSGSQVQWGFPLELDFSSHDLHFRTEGIGCESPTMVGCAQEVGVLNVTFGDESGQVYWDEPAQIGSLVLGVGANSRVIDHTFCDSVAFLVYAGFGARD